MIICKLWGIRFKLNWLFLVVLLLFALVGDLTRALTAFTAVFLHELGHVFVGVLYGMKVREVELLPFGGVAVFEGLLETQYRAERRVAFAGPAVNICLVIATALLTRYQLIPLKDALFFITFNLHIGIFNLIPALPLDGGRVLRSFLAEHMGYLHGTHLTLRVTKIFAVLAGSLAFLSWLWGTVSPISLIAAFFVYFAAIKEEEQSIFVLMKYLSRKKKLLEEAEVVKSDQYLVMSDTMLIQVLKAVNPRSYAHFLICDKDYHILGKLSEMEVMDAFFEKGINVPVKDLLSLK